MFIFFFFFSWSNDNGLALLDGMAFSCFNRRAAITAWSIRIWIHQLRTPIPSSCEAPCTCSSLAAPNRIIIPVRHGTVCGADLITTPLLGTPASAGVNKSPKKDAGARSLA